MLTPSLLLLSLLLLLLVGGGSHIPDTPHARQHRRGPFILSESSLKFNIALPMWAYYVPSGNLT